MAPPLPLKVRGFKLGEDLLGDELFREPFLAKLVCWGFADISRTLRLTKPGLPPKYEEKTHYAAAAAMTTVREPLHWYIPRKIFLTLNIL